MFVSSVLDGSYKKLRESTENNPHLAKLVSKDKDLMEKWFQGGSLKMEEKQAVLPVEVIKEILYQAIMGGGVNVDSALVEVLQGQKLIELASKEINDKLISLQQKKDKSNAAKIESDTLQHSRNFLRMLNPTLPKSQFLSYINTIKKKLTKEIKALKAGGKSEQVQGKENFLKHLDSLSTLITSLNRNTKPIFLADTDDPFDILLCGTEVGSCQAVDGDPKHSRGLLGYLFNGQTRIITAKLEEGSDAPIAARAFIRLLFDDKNKPVMVLEGIYPESYDRPGIKKLHDRLIEFALIRSKALGVDLVTKWNPEKTDGKSYSTLYAEAGAMPEYVDSVKVPAYHSRIQEEAYKIVGVHKVVESLVS